MRLVFLSLIMLALAASPVRGQALVSFPNAQAKAAFQPAAPDADGFVHVWVHGESAAIRAAAESLGGRFKYQVGARQCAVAVPFDRLADLQRHPAVEQWEGPGSPVRPLGDIMLMRSRADSVHLGAAPLPQAYEGEGVVLGFVDQGIDTDHGDFRDSLGRTRVKWIWDQNLPADGTEPAPYGYGQTCDSAAIEAAACNHTDPYNYYSHGTGVTGVAAGNGLAIDRYKGVAPKADIVAVNLSFDAAFLTNVADAVQYIFDYAASVNKPCVINTSVGTYLGSHDGKDATAQFIDGLLAARNGRAVVAAVGNAGDRIFHLGHEAGTDTAFTWFRWEGSLGAAYLQGWIDTTDARDWQLAVGVNHPTTYALEDRGPWLNLHDFDGSGAFDSTSYPLGPGGALGTVETWVQRQGDRFFFEVVVWSDSTDRRWRLESTGSGRMDLWSDPAVTGTSYLYRGADLPDAVTYPDILRYVEPDDEQTLVSSWQCSDRVIAVGSYYNRDTMTNYLGNNPPLVCVPGERIVSSSNGPTRDGRIKPDISASGQWVLATASGNSSSWLMGIGTGAALYVAWGGQHYLQGGTSFSSPIVAGAAALYLNRYPNADWRAIKEAILQGARADSFTGTDLPNQQWGYGKVNAFASLQVDDTPCATPTGVSAAHVLDTAVRVEWTAVPEAIGYALEGRRMGTDRWVTKLSYNTYEGVGNLRPSTLYEFRLRALCGIVDSSAWTSFNVFATSASREALDLSRAAVFPNPAQDYVNLDYVAPTGSSQWVFELRDLPGRVVQEHVLPSAEGRTRWTPDGLPAGVYLYRFTADGQAWHSGKLLLE